MSGTTSTSDVTLASVSKRYGTVVAVDRLSLEIPHGEFISLLGPSGCGKTTLLRLIAGFERATEGDVFIRGKRVTDVPAHRRDFSMVFQSYALFPHLTVAENVAFGLKVRGLSRSDRDRRIREALELVKLKGFEARYPRELSGGQQQRVALARAVVVRPAVLLLDEPLAALDKKLREEMQIELRQLHSQLDMTTVFVTHDQEEALTMSDRIAVMHAGRIQQIGPPRAVYERPATEFVATFMGTNNILRGKVAGAANGSLSIDFEIGRFEVAGTAPVGSNVSVAIRPERIRVRPAQAGDRRARVEDIVYVGSSTQLYLRCRETRLLAVVPNDCDGAVSFRCGDEVEFEWSAESLVPFLPPPSA